MLLRWLSFLTSMKATYLPTAVIIRSGFKAPDLNLDHVEGPVNIIGVQRRSSSSSTYYTAHELHIGGRMFNVDSSVGSLLMQGDRYAVYFLKGSSRIMSIERLE